MYVEAAAIWPRFYQGPNLLLLGQEQDPKLTIKNAHFWGRLGLSPNDCVIRLSTHKLYSPEKGIQVEGEFLIRHKSSTQIFVNFRGKAFIRFLYFNCLFSNVNNS